MYDRFVQSADEGTLESPLHTHSILFKLNKIKFARPQRQLLASKISLEFIKTAIIFAPASWFKIMKIKDLEFEHFIGSDIIQKKVTELSQQINLAYEGKAPVFLPILNGSFIFASDLIKQIHLPCRVSFVKISSYQGVQSTGQLKTLIGHEESFFHQDVIIVEDVIDSGLTLEKIVEELKSL